MESFSIILRDHYISAGLKEKIITLLKKPVVYHSLFWIGYFVFNIFRWGNYFDDYGYSLRSNLVEFPIHLVLVYFNLYYLLPRYIPSRLTKYLMMLFVALIAMSLVRIVLTYNLVTTEIWRESVVKDQAMFGLNYIIAVAIGELYVIGLTMAIKLIIDWVSAQKKELESLSEETMKLNYLFLDPKCSHTSFFNTLNNLYSLTLDKSDKAPETVLKLSELMSYVIYRGKNKQVSLPDEVSHIHNYIDLERLRYGNKHIAEVNISGDIQNKAIPPLILMPFIENAFKHGSDYKNGKKPILIGLEIKQNTLYFTVRNSKKKNFTGAKAINSNSGIGIQNTIRRLELLYDRDFNLSIKDDEDQYKISLKLILDEN